MRRAAAVIVLGMLGLLAGCGERDQSTANAKRSADKPAWDSSSSKYVVPGYTPGDKAAWEAQLRERAQAQNDFAPSRK
ncbi:MAG TPA: hypothetical protein VMU47_14620 [Caldimonas sp.]|nr:hypothetical protein [Caldimonas sp.]